MITYLFFWQIPESDPLAKQRDQRRGGGGGVLKRLCHSDVLFQKWYVINFLLLLEN